MRGDPARWRLYGLALREAGRVLPRRLRRAASSRRFRTPKPQRLLFAPQDLRTSDPTLAEDIYGGVFAFAGRAVQTGGRSPFAIEPPSEDWAEALYGFGWLRHLRAADTPLARNHARTLVEEAVGRRRAELDRGPAGRVPVVARRVMSFLCQSPLVLGGADHALYQSFLGAIGRGVATLEASLLGAERPSDRLASAVALSYASLCCSGLENRLRRATRALSSELDVQILDDGGHVSRHPGTLVELLLDLLPLRLLYASRGLEAPEALGRAVERMMPMLRYLRHEAGDVALFNGMGRTATDHIATLLSYDLTQGRPVEHAERSGYTRLRHSSTLVLADTGPSPPMASSEAAHAGCLSFELSSGPDRIVVNCGAPRPGDGARAAARRTAAHSTLELSGESSCVFLSDRRGGIATWLRRRIGPVVLSGPSRVEFTEGPAPGADEPSFTARHDGYRTRFGIVHERALRIAADGESLVGEDRLIVQDGRDATPEVAIRFHLHPAVRVEPGAGPADAILRPASGPAWRFSAETGRLAVEESVFFGGAERRRPTVQLVLRPPPGGPDPVRWRFDRIDRANEPA